MDEVVRGGVRVSELVSHVYDVDRVADAFQLLDESPEEALLVVLRFPPAP